MGRIRKRWMVAAVQMRSTGNVGRNLRAVERLTGEAAATGARLVALPENLACLRARDASPPPCAGTLDGELVRFLGDLARCHRIHLLAGSVPETIHGSRRVHKTSVLLGPSGRILAAYRKMHLFDLRVRGGPRLSEPRSVAPGDRPVVVRTPLGRLGLSICYDLRFPELYRRLTFLGARVLFVPAAFTAHTGPHHWLPLLRARAMENQCWVVAPAQCGRHNARRASHGHTAVVDPWGEVVAMRPEGEGIVTAEVDLDRVARVRAALPCLRHARRELFLPPPRGFRP